MRIKIAWHRLQGQVLVMQVLEMDERLRGKNITPTACDDGFLAGSGLHPTLNAVRVWLRGSSRVDDYTPGFIAFDSDTDRERYIQRANAAIRAWVDYHLPESAPADPAIGPEVFEA